MSQVQLTDLSSVLNNAFSAPQQTVSSDSENIKNIKELLKELPSILKEETLSDISNGDYNISLKQYTDLSSYNTAMSTLYANNSSNKFQNLLNTALGTYEDNLANAKNFIDKLKSEGMSNKTAVHTYQALQKYSLAASVENNNFVNAKI